MLATGLPAGVGYSVEERQYIGYDTSVSVDGGEYVTGNIATGTITSQGDAVSTVKFLNASQIPDAGDRSQPALWLAMALGALTCLVAVCRRRKEA